MPRSSAVRPLKPSGAGRAASGGASAGSGPESKSMRDSATPTTRTTSATTIHNSSFASFLIMTGVRALQGDRLGEVESGRLAARHAVAGVAVGRDGLIDRLAHAVDAAERLVRRRAYATA